MARSRNKKTEIEEEIEKRIPTTRYNPDYKVGLTAQQVQEHRLHGWVNRAVDPPSKTTKEVIHENVFTYFNLIFLVLAILLCSGWILPGSDLLPGYYCKYVDRYYTGSACQKSAG